MLPVILSFITIAIHEWLIKKTLQSTRSILGVGLYFIAVAGLIFGFLAILYTFEENRLVVIAVFLGYNLIKILRGIFLSFYPKCGK